MKKLLTVLAAAFIAVSSFAYTERNLLAGRVSKEDLKEMLLPNRQWVDLPAYSDRQAWDSLLGDQKDFYIRRGERALRHKWPRDKATDYLE